MRNFILSKRTKFFFSHLMISSFIVLILLIWVFCFWYPYPLSKAVGVTHIVLILIIIDVIIGPGLGFLVFKEGKKSLKFDLAVIILLQLSALCYGVYSIAQGRPVWLAYNVDRIELIRNNEIVKDNIDQAKLQFQKSSWIKPHYVSVFFSNDLKKRQDDMFADVFGGISVAQKPERYVDFTKALPQIKKRAKSLNNLEQFNDQKQVQKILTKYPQATGYMPLKANAVDMTVLVNKETGEVVKIVDLRPW